MGYVVWDSSAIITGMTDQPADQPNHAVVDGNQPATDQPITPPLLTLDEAAAELGITVNAVRQRIKRGTLSGIKTEAGWLVDMVATNQESGTDRPTTRPTNHTSAATDHQPTIDLAPLTELIDDLTRRNADLAAAAALWQTRAAHLENELKQLTAGTSEPEATSETPESPQTSEPMLTGVVAWLRRLWRV